MKSEKHLKFVRSLPCANCAAPPPSQAHHAIDIGLIPGMGTKTGDYYSMPLCNFCHYGMHGTPDIKDKQWKWIARTLVKRLEMIDNKT